MRWCCNKPQPKLTCPKSTKEAVEKVVKYVQN